MPRLSWFGHQSWRDVPVPAAGWNGQVVPADMKFSLNGLSPTIRSDLEADPQVCFTQRAAGGGQRQRPDALGRLLVFVMLRAVPDRWCHYPGPFFEFGLMNDFHEFDRMRR
jgi:hypothetical protein